MIKRAPWEIRRKEKAFEDGKTEGLTKKDIYEISRSKLEAIEKQLNVRDRQIRLIQETSSELGILLSLDEIVSKVHTFLKKAFGINHSAVLFTEPDGHELSAYSCCGFPKEVHSYRGKFGKGMIGVAAETKKTIVTNRVMQNIRYRLVSETGHPLGTDEKIKPWKYDFQLSEEAQSKLAIPLLSVKDTIGVLYLECEEPDFFGEADVEAINIVAAQMATAVRNARLFLEVKERATELDSINQQLRAGEQQLRAANQQLSVGEQQLRCTNQQLRASEEQVQRHNRFLNDIFESLSHPFYVINADTYRVELANSASTGLFGAVSPDSTCYSLTHDRSTPCSGDHVCPLKQIKRTKKSVVTEHTHYDEKGNPRFVEVHGYPVFDAEGNVERIIEYSLDITDRRKAQQDLQTAYTRLEEQSALLAQSEKTIAVGTLVAGAAHELNNPLTAVLNFSAHCRNRISKDDELHSVLEDIEHEAKRCADIIQNLTTFSEIGKDKDAYEKASLAEIIGRVLELLSWRIENEGISLALDVAQETPDIWMNATTVQQLILNITTNALDAMKNSDKKELNVDLSSEGEFVRMTFADTGCGIEDGSLKSIFDPFFTTKPVGQGVGLGLSACQGVVKAHGGQITCQSEPGVGTQITILFPIEKDERSNENE